MDVVTVVICTRDRPEPLARMVRSLLSQSSVEPFELIVIDQGDGAQSVAALGQCAVDPRLRHVRSAPRGAGAALQEGLRLARGKIVLVGDDDCEAPPGWLAGMVRVIGEHPTAAIAFSSVCAAPHDPTTGYVPTYMPSQSRLVRSVAETCWGHGISAGMAVRRDVILELGGFDEAIGPGGPFPAGDDWDITFRVLLAGWSVFEAIDVVIVHHGYRTFAQGRAHAQRDWVGIGAVCSKLLRCGHLAPMIVPVWEFLAHAMLPPLVDLICFRRPKGLSRILGFLQGLAIGLATPLDRNTLRFLPRDSFASKKPFIADN